MGSRGDVLAWLNTEQRKAARWFRGDTGIYQFSLTGPELNRIRYALGEPDGEWQCRFIEGQKCCLLPKGHLGGHKL